MSIQYKLKVRYLRRLPNPYEEYTNGTKNPETYEILVDIKELPDDLNMYTNPRFQNMMVVSMVDIHLNLYNL